MLTDMLGTLLSFWFALILRFGSFGEATHRDTYYLVLLLALVFIISYSFVSVGGRDFIRRGYFVELGHVFRFIACLYLFLGICIFLMRMGSGVSRLVFGYAIVINFALCCAIRLFIKKILRITISGDTYGKKVVLISSGSEGQKAFTELKRKLDVEMILTGRIEWRGDIKDLARELKTLPVDEVFLHLPGTDGAALWEIVTLVGTMGLTCRVSLYIPGMDLRGASAGDYGGYKVLSYGEGRDYGGALMIKRLLDILGGLVGIIITAVMYPFIALAIKLDSPGPVVFSQVRIGKNGRRFKIYKFRSMYKDAEERKRELEAQNEMKGLMFKLEDDPRVTKVGGFLRKTSLDEFPQFLNVLKGEMSLVGTRPPTEDEFLQYTPHYRRRLCMTPGLTGLWQVSGRSDISDFDDVVKYDLEYIDNWSIGLDIKIILQTVGVVLMGKGAK